MIAFWNLTNSNIVLYLSGCSLEITYTLCTHLAVDNCRYIRSRRSRLELITAENQWRYRSECYCLPDCYCEHYTNGHALFHLNKLQSNPHLDRQTSRHTLTGGKREILFSRLLFEYENDTTFSLPFKKTQKLYCILNTLHVQLYKRLYLFMFYVLQKAHKNKDLLYRRCLLNSIQFDTYHWKKMPDLIFRIPFNKFIYFTNCNSSFKLGRFFYLECNRLIYKQSKRLISCSCVLNTIN